MKNSENTQKMRIEKRNKERKRLGEWTRKLHEKQAELYRTGRLRVGQKN